VRAAAYSRRGPAERVLRVLDLPDPRPGRGEVRVRIACSAVNPSDIRARRYARGPLPFPLIVPHQDGAGTIDAVGPSVPRARLGERVWVYNACYGRPFGTAAEWVVLPSFQARPLPEQVPFELGASLGVPALTAHRCLFADGSVRGRSVLVAGGAGAVGHFAVELARWGGARVAATASSERKRRLARAAGAELAVDYRAADAAERLRAFAPRGFDRIIEVDLRSNLALDLAVAAPHAVIAVYATGPLAAGRPRGRPLPRAAVERMMLANLAIRLVWVYGIPDGARRRALADIAACLRQGALSRLPERRFPLERIADAHLAVERGAPAKVLVEP